MIQDRRLPPFCWQSLAALEILHDELPKGALAPALALYQGLTYLSSKKQNGLHEGFPATRAEVCRASGLSAGTVHKYAGELERVHLLVKEEREHEGRSIAPLWTLTDANGVSGDDTRGSRNAQQLTPTRAGETSTARRKKSSPNGEESSSFSVQTKEIFEHWKGAMELNGNAKLTADRRQKVVARLKEGLPMEEIKRAIDGVAASSYHRSHNYNDLELICRTGSHVQRYAQFPLAGEELTDHQKEVERALERVPEPDADEVERNLASVGI